MRFEEVAKSEAELERTGCASECAPPASNLKIKGLVDYSSSEYGIRKMSDHRTVLGIRFTQQFTV